MLQQALPAIFCYLADKLLPVVNIIYIGQQGDALLIAGVGVGDMIMNIFGRAIVYGLNGALVTLVS